MPFAEEIVDLADKPEHFKRMYADLSPVPTARAKVPNQGCELKGSRGPHAPHTPQCGAKGSSPGLLTQGVFAPRRGSLGSSLWIGNVPQKTRPHLWCQGLWLGSKADSAARTE